MDKKVPYLLEDTSPLLEGRLTPGQLPIFRHGSISEFLGIHKNSDYTDYEPITQIGNTSRARIICVIIF
jgi:hypothetical protein